MFLCRSPLLFCTPCSVSFRSFSSRILKRETSTSTLILHLSNCHLFISSQCLLRKLLIPIFQSTKMFFVSLFIGSQPSTEFFISIITFEISNISTITFVITISSWFLYLLLLALFFFSIVFFLSKNNYYTYFLNYCSFYFLWFILFVKFLHRTFTPHISHHFPCKFIFYSLRTINCLD